MKQIIKYILRGVCFLLLLCFGLIVLPLYLGMFLLEMIEWMVYLRFSKERSLLYITHAGVVMDWIWNEDGVNEDGVEDKTK